MLRTVTFTGADESVAPSMMPGEIGDLSLRFPYVEWGILVSQAKTGTCPRYPGIEWIKKLKDISDPYDPNYPKLSLHVCGRWGRNLLLGKVDGALVKILSMANFSRIQINCSDPAYNVESMCIDPQGAFKGREIIVPVGKQKNKKLFECTREGGMHVVPMFDESGGKGISANEWPTPDEMTGPCHPRPLKYGYAGGLGPDNIAQELEKIDRKMNANNRPLLLPDFWVDMETKIRSSDDRIFDLNKVKAVINAVEEFRNFQ